MVALFEQLGDEMAEEVKHAILQEERMTYKAFAGINRYIQICFENKNVAQILLVESVGVSRNVELVRQRSHQVFATIILQTVETELPTTVTQKEMRIVAQAMVGAINEVIMQFFLKQRGRISFWRNISFAQPHCHFCVRKSGIAGIRFF